MRNNGHTRVPTAEASTSVLLTRQYAGLPEVFMKLRRVMAAAAATAAIAPIALLSAPAAFATEDTTTSSPSATATETAEPSETASPSETAEPTETAAPSETAEPTETAAPTETAKPSETATATEKPTETAKPTEEPTEAPTDCPVDDEGVDVDSKLELGLSGLPGKIVAGSGWHQFKLTASNPSDEDLGEVQWLAAVDNWSDSEDEQDWLANYAQIQYFNPDSKSWESIADEVTGGLYFGATELGAKEKVDIKLRVNISAKAPAGDGYALGLGGYLDSEANCVHNAFAFYEFTVLKAGSSNENPGEAEEKPGQDGKKPQGGKAPQGGTNEIPATGNLAETGSSSMLPTIGLVGGVAVVAGAGAVFIVRRKKADATA
ncbi:LAETG motif-containing sortase-dependent surface protein [Streptomyces sp. NPDC059037]|uniref:LAETG motif-containing sortase-dependent surface protein n=1 Tax=Streptomyces sp. NPDC059037 TaxID=3346710 RepID=UPI0036CEF910